MDAPIAQVAVERTDVVVTGVERPKLANVGAYTVRRHGRVFPALPGFPLTGSAGGGAEAGLAHGPDQGGFASIVEELHGGRLRAAPELVHQAPSLVIGLIDRLATELDEEPAAALGQALD